MNKFFNWSAKTWFLIAGVVFLTVFAIRLPNDPDMGWHLGSGRYLWTHFWPPMTDLFSWTMPNFPWVAHEWLTDRLMYGLTQIGGLGLLTTIFTLIVALTFWLLTRMRQFRNIPYSATIGAAITLMVCWNVIGVRPQMLTLLGTVLVLMILFAWRETRKASLIYWLPIIFAIWANFHGGFLSGMAVIGTFGIAEVIRKVLAGAHPLKKWQVISWREFWWVAAVGGVGSLAATLFNPYGWRVYHEIYYTLSQPDILNQIGEWLPVTLHSANSYNAALLGTLLLALVLINKFNFDITKLILAVVFLFFGITSWRHLPLFAIASAPLLIEQLGLLIESGLQQLTRQKIFTIVVIIALLWWGGLRANYVRMALATPLNYSYATDYPYSAIQYLKAHPATGNLVTEYGWGGYLIWQYPEKKVFIDGRMAIWKQGNFRIFDDYRYILSGNTNLMKQMFDKWHPGIMVIPTNHPANTNLYRDFSGTWKAVYRDSIATVWEATNQPDN